MYKLTKSCTVVIQLYLYLFWSDTAVVEDPEKPGITDYPTGTVYTMLEIGS